MLTVLGDIRGNVFPTRYLVVFRRVSLFKRSIFRWERYKINIQMIFFCPNGSLFRHFTVLVCTTAHGHVPVVQWKRNLRCPQFISTRIKCRFREFCKVILSRYFNRREPHFILNVNIFTSTKKFGVRAKFLRYNIPQPDVKCLITFTKTLRTLKGQGFAHSVQNPWPFSVITRNGGRMPNSSDGLKAWQTLSYLPAMFRELHQCHI